MNSYDDAIITDKSKIKSTFIRLDKQVISFHVVNLRGTIIASVKDTYTDQKNNLHLLISPLNNPNEHQQYLMDSDWVQQIGTTQKILVVNLSESDITKLPVINQANIHGESLTPETNTSSPSKLAETSTNEILHSSESREVTVPLLEERLLVKRDKHKLGEVIIRKKVETHLVQVPVRREILIIEQLGSPNKQLTEIDLAESQVPGVTINTNENKDVNFIVRGELMSPQVASEILREISLQQQNSCKKISLEIEVENHEQQVKYQEIINRWMTS
ncbi:DUF2382 domain-containing protein [Mastigocoleus testarum]|uniref:DUF2382 domain-containing protein n=1 Tax=Mastigocoleus testarum BC008 TaxID=371196 RepID=A0A0V7ZN33_9CYAN|nr:DUF2382 domain-containing protein [Mastigocoleus testarum]KST65932.1 hypothetical protein BC008_23475 [Mastigocoleus testarum BC008]